MDQSIGHFPAGIRFAIDDSSVSLTGVAGVSIYEEKKSNQENIGVVAVEYAISTGTCRCHFGYF